MADAAIGNWIAELFTQQVNSVKTAFQNADVQVDAILQQGKSVATAQAAAAGALASASEAKGGSSFASPQQNGLGTPPVAASSLLTSGTGGTYTLTGNGAAVWGISDNCAFAGAQAVQSLVTYTCRVTSLTNVTCPSLSQWANVGLMVRGDLSNDAPMVLLSVTGAHGIELVYRVVAGQNPGRQRPASATAGTGLVGPDALTSGSKTASPSTKPVWLQFRRDGGTWTAYTSMDGKTFTQAGNPVTVEMAGAWVGLYACANNGQFKGIGTIKASFDQLQGFGPSTVVQIGVAEAGAKKA